MNPFLHRLFTKIAIIEFVILSAFGVYYFGYYHKKPISGPIRLQALDIITPTPTPMATDTPSPSIAPLPTAKPTPGLAVYQDKTYQFKVSYPPAWQSDTKTNTPMAHKVYAISSPDTASSVTITVSDGIWADVKLELGVWSKKSKFANQPALIRTSSDKKTKTYIFPSIQDGIIFQVAVTGTSKSLDQILSSFKFTN